MGKLQVLVLGLGFFGRSWLKEVTACSDCEVAGVVAKHPELLSAVGDEFAVPASARHASVEEGLDRSGAQAVVVALPEMVHREAIIAALERGLHVVTEKPLAMDMAEAADIVRAARRVRQAVVMVDQNYRWRPRTQALRRAVREGKIGKVSSISFEFRQAITRKTTDAWRERMPHPYLHDMIVHHFDMLRATTGEECVELVAWGMRPSWSWYQGLPAVDVLLSFHGGMQVSYAGTMVAQGYVTPQEGIITLIGEHGTLRLEADQQVRWYRDTQIEILPPVEMAHADIGYALREFLGAIREGRRPETHLEDNVRSLAMMAAAIKSVESHQPVKIAPLVTEALGE